MNIRPTAKEMKRAKMIGRNRFTFSVVSNMITASENDSLVYPASTDAAPIVAYVAGYTACSMFVEMKRLIMRPREHPIKMPGKNRPAGTAVPYVMIVIRYQIRK